MVLQNTLHAFKGFVNASVLQPCPQSYMNGVFVMEMHRSRWQLAPVSWPTCRQAYRVDFEIIETQTRAPFLSPTILWVTATLPEGKLTPVMGRQLPDSLGEVKSFFTHLPVVSHSRQCVSLDLYYLIGISLRSLLVIPLLILVWRT